MAGKKKIVEADISENSGVDLGAIINADKGSKKGDAIRDPLSSFLADGEVTPKFLSTGIISLDLGISGRVRGGIPKGHITMIPGPSKMGKSFISLAVAKSAQKEGMSVVIIDTERGFSESMAKGFGIDTSKEKFALFRGPGVNSIEHVRSIIVKLTEDIPLSKRENLLIIIDSWGAFVTSKTVKDALSGNEAADMTEARSLNNLANVLLSTGCTGLVINHVYDATGVSFGNPTKIRGGKRIYYVSSSVILGTGRSQEKDGDDISGFIISCSNDKGRFAKERLTFEFRIKLSGGLDMFYGLLPFAIEGGFVEKVKNGNSWNYIRGCVENDQPVSEKKVYTSDFWKPVFKQSNFVEYIEELFRYEEKFETNDDFYSTLDIEGETDEESVGE